MYIAMCVRIIVIIMYVVFCFHDYSVYDCIIYVCEQWWTYLQYGD